MTALEVMYWCLGAVFVLLFVKIVLLLEQVHKMFRFLMIESGIDPDWSEATLRSLVDLETRPLIREEE